MCFDLSDKKGMQWSISIGSCANMRIVRELWQDFSGFICLQELCLICRIVLILVFLSLIWVTSHTILVFRRPKVQNLQSSCYISLFKVLNLVLPEVHNLLKLKWPLPSWKKISYPNLFILRTSCKLDFLQNHTEQSYMSLKSNAMMPNSFSSYFVSNKYVKFWSGTLAQVWTSSLLCLQGHTVAGMFWSSLIMHISSIAA